MSGLSEPDVTALTLKIAGAIYDHASDNTGTKAEAIMQVVMDSEWLAAIRAEAKAEALREAGDALVYDLTAADGYATWLRARADRIGGDQ